jgi:vacuolar protein sorting-associated protein 16
VAEFELLSSSDVAPIVECHFWGNGLAAMTSNACIKVAEGLASSDIRSSMPRVYKLETKLGRDETYTAMTLIPPLLSKSGLLEVLVGTSARSILTIHENGDGQEIEDQLLAQKLGSPPTKIALSPDGCHIAVYRKDGILTVMSASFSTKIVDFDTRSASRPVAVEWCGKDAVLIRWLNTGIVMVSE